MCLYVSMHVYACVYMHVCIYCVYMYICMYCVYMYIYFCRVCTCVYACVVCVGVYACIVCVCVWVYDVYVYIMYMYICIISQESSLEELFLSPLQINPTMSRQNNYFWYLLCYMEVKYRCFINCNSSTKCPAKR